MNRSYFMVLFRCSFPFLVEKSGAVVNSQIVSNDNMDAINSCTDDEIVQVSYESEIDVYRCLCSNS